MSRRLVMEVTRAGCNKIALAIVASLDTDNVGTLLLLPGAARRWGVAWQQQDPRRSAVTVTTLSSREFNQDVSRAKRAADQGPVIITDRGTPAYVLLRHEEYRRLAGGPSIRELLDQPGVEEIDFEPPRFGGGTFRVPP